jgi:hypothetical protein
MTKHNEIQEVTAEPVVHTLCIKEAEEIRKRLVELKGVIESSYLEVGKLLGEVCECTLDSGKQLWKHWGFASFDEYCEREMGFRQRKGYHLLSIYKQCISGPIPKAEFEKIGWSKASILAPLISSGVITEENVHRWVEKANEKTYDELRAMTKLAKAKSEEKAKEDEEKGVVGSVARVPEEVIPVRIPFFRDQYENYKVALKKAEKITGSDKVPWLMDCICMHFNSEVCTTKEDSLHALCSRLEEVFSVDIIALHRKDKQVVFGERVAQMLERTRTAKMIKEEKEREEREKLSEEA